jgi:hypothetical protein
VCKWYAYWAVVSTLIAYLFCFADVHLACISLYACSSKHTDVDMSSGLSYTRTSTCICSMAVLLMSIFCMCQCVKVSLVYTDVTSHGTH